MSEKKSPLIPILIGVVLLAAGAFFMYQQNQPAGTTDTASLEITEEVDTNNASTSEEEAMEVAGSNAETGTETNNDGNPGQTPSSASIDVEKAMEVRALGNPEAPLVIREHASLTCGHCGTFHQETFDQLKAEYIDTGKVYFIFTDFPLNGPALHAGMIARCLPHERYFNFLDMLFKSQDKWAYEPTYLTYLRQNAALAGLGNDAFDACVGNQELQDALTTQMREAQQKYSISSTPTFVLNEDNVVSGARDFAFFKNIIEEELAKAE